MQKDKQLSLVSRLAPSGGVIHLIRMLEKEGIDYTSIKDVLSMDFSELTQQNLRIEAGKILEVYKLEKGYREILDF